MSEIKTTNAYLGFIRESVAEGASVPSKEDLDYALHDIWMRNRVAEKLMDDLYKYLQWDEMRKGQIHK